MLGQNHFAEPNANVLTFLHPKFAVHCTGGVALTIVLWCWWSGCEQEIQAKREATLKACLLEHIEPYVRGEKQEFVNWATEERNRLKEAGTSFLSTTLRLLIVLLSQSNLQTGKTDLQSTLPSIVQALLYGNVSSFGYVGWHSFWASNATDNRVHLSKTGGKGAWQKDALSWSTFCDWMDAWQRPFYQIPDHCCYRYCNTIQVCLMSNYSFKIGLCSRASTNQN